MGSTTLDRSKLRVNSLMWGDAMFPYIERNEVQETTLLDITNEVQEWQVIFERLFKSSPAKIVEVAWNSRMSTTSGRCRRVPGGFKLEFNPAFVASCTSTGFHEVIAHEVMHTLPQAFNHGRYFKMYASVLRNITTVSVARICRDEAFIAQQSDLKEQRQRFKITCEKCGRIVAHRERTCKLVEHPEMYRCGICNGALRVSKIYRKENEK